MAANRNSRVVDSLDGLQSSHHDFFSNPPTNISSGTLNPKSLVSTPRTHDDPAQTREIEEAGWERNPKRSRVPPLRHKEPFRIISKTREIDYIPGTASHSSSGASSVLVPPILLIPTATTEPLTTAPPMQPVLSITPIGDAVHKQNLEDQEEAEDSVMPLESLPQSLPQLYVRRASWHSYYLDSSRPSDRRPSVIGPHSAFWAEHTPTSAKSSRISVASSEQSWYTALSSTASRSTASFRSANSGYVASLSENLDRIF